MSDRRGTLAAVVLVSPIVAVLALLLAIALTVFGDRGPLHGFRCDFEVRDGWTVTLPPAPVPLAEFEESIRDQTNNCVQLLIEGPEGIEALVQSPVGAGEWIGSNRTIDVVTWFP